MKSTDSRRPSSGKSHGKNPLPVSDSKASGSPKASKASSAVQSSDAASKAGVKALGTKMPHRLHSPSKASSSAKSLKGRSLVQGSDPASKADAKDDGTGKRPLVAEPSTSRRPSGAAVGKGGSTTTDVKADRADKTLTSRDRSESSRPKEPKDDGSKAVPENADDSQFHSAQSTLFVTPRIETMAERKKQAPPSQESVPKEKNKGGAKEKDTTSPATSSPALEVSNQEKTPAAVNDEADAKAPKTQEKKNSITFNKISAKSHEGKKQRKKRGHSRGNKAVQTNPEDAQMAPAGPPIHLLFSPSSCSLCDSNAPPSSYGAMQAFQIGKYGAVIAATPVVTPAQKHSRGVVKKKTTTTTTTTTRRVQDSDRSRTPRSRQLAEETTTEEVQEAADDRSDADGSKDSTSVAGNVTSGGAVKKTVTTMRRPKNRHKHGRNSDTSDGVEGTITEVIGPAETEAKQAAVEKQPDGAKAGGTVVELSAKKNVASGALKKTVKTTRRLKDADRDPRPQNDVIETVTREVVEVESESAPEQPPAAAPVIAGLARGASTTQYRYVESRRPASSPYRARHGVDAVYQRMQLRPPGFWTNQPYRRAL
nr:neurofilament heavy polypeptide-like [Dermacentor andersoni]